MPPAPPTLPLNNQAALNAAQAGSAAITDPSNPLGASQNAVLQPIHDITYNHLQTGAAANAAINQAQIDVAAQKAAAAAQNDPNKYTRVQAPDGGWNFYGPDGKPVSAADFARVKQVPVDKVLGDSQNPIDIAFQQDYQQLQNYFKDKINAAHNQTAADNAAATEAAVKKNYGVNLASLNHQQVVQQFMQSYPTVFGGTSTGVQGTNALYPAPKIPDTTATTDTSL